MLTSILLFLNKLWGNRIAIVLGAFGVLIAAFYLYYTIASSRIDELTRHNQELQTIIDQQKKAIEQLQRDYKHVIEAKEELNKQIQDTQTEVQELREKLFRENQGKRPLEELATKKTTLIEKKINKATDAALRCLELLTRGGDC